MRTNALTKVLMVAVGLWALPALPGPDTYLVGNGQDGARNIGGGSGGTVINNYAQVLEPLAPGDTTLKTSLATITSQSGSNVPDFNGPGGGTDGDLVMIIQTTGLVPAAAVGSAAPISLEGSAVGRWELARITNVNRSVEDELTLTLDRPLKYSYAADVTQVVRVPEYTALTLTNNAVVRAGNWDPETYTGGVLAFLATGAVTLGTGSKLSAKGAGFHGGTYVADIAVDGNDQPIKGCPASGRPDSTRAFSGEGLNAAANSPRGVDNVANGGGGGVCLRAGGGGGGNAGAGGRGGSSDSASDEGRGAAAGQGGAALNASPLMQLLMGGGGGAGHGRSASPTPRGGHGGGIIFVRAQSLSGGMLDASGDAGVASNEDGAGGGGAGGTIHARFLHATPCGASNFLDVRGGAGGATTHGGEGLRGPGGGGGGGRVLFQSRNTATCAVNVASGVAGLAVAGNHHDAVPGNSSFPYAGTATLMGTEFVAPAQPTITVPAGSIVTNNPLPTLSGISTANSEVVIYALEGGVVSGVEYGRGVVGSNGSFSLTLSRPLQTGEITHLVAVTEAQGLQGAPSASRAFTVDTEAPDTYFAENGVPASPSRLSSVSFTFASNELTGITYQCQVVSGIGTTAPSTGWEPCDSPYTTTTTLTDGLTYTMWVRAHDAAGNRDPTPARYSWLVDWTRPETEFAANGTPGGASNVVNPVFRFTTEANATFECILVPPGATTAPLETDSRWAACTNPYVAPTRSDNTANTLWVRAVDAAGNVDDTPATYSWTVDLRDPDTEFTGTLPEPVNNLESVTFTFSSNESNVIFECSLNGAGFSPCTSGSSIATTELEASFTLLVRAKDPANNVDKTPARYDWRTDKVRPDTVLHTTMGSLSNALQAGFDFNSPDADVVGFECILASPSTAPMPDEEDARWAGCAASYLTPELTHNTTYRLWVRAVDAAGNVDGMPASHEWRVDLEPPDTELTAPLPAPVNNQTSVPFTFSSNDPQATFECSLNGAPFATCTSGIIVQTPGADAPFRFLVRARDTAGNVDPTPAAYSWRTDKVRPDTQVVALVDSPSNALRARFNLSSPDTDVVGFQCILVRPSSTTMPEEDDEDWEACGASHLTSELITSTYTLWARAVDAAGNVDATPAGATWTVDRDPPDTVITSKPDALTGEPTTAFAFRGGDNDTDVVGFECSYDGRDFLPCESPFALPNPPGIPVYAEGDHSMLIRAVDAAGNRDETPANHIWRLVVGDPVTYFQTAPPTVTRQTSASFSFTSNLTTVIYACQLDDEPREEDCATSESPTKPYTGLAEGGHTLRVWARGGGREASSPSVYNWTVDLTGPVAPVINVPAQNDVYFNVQWPQFSGRVSERGTFIIKMDGDIVGTFQVSEQSLSWSFESPVQLADGPHVLAVSLTDAVGNDGAEAFRTFTVDATKPETRLTAAPPHLTNQPRAVFQFESNEVGTTFECSLDGGAFASCTGPNSHEVTVGDALHTFAVRAVDRAGNVADVQGAHEWRVDSVAPTTNIIEMPVADTNVARAVFRFESDESFVNFECSIDGAAFDNCPPAYTWDGVPEGEHRIEVRARDEAGNVDATPAVHVWRLDTTPPLVPVVSSPAPEAVVGSLTPTFQGSAEPGSEVLLFVDGLDFGSARVEPTGQWRLTLTRAISEGDHRFSALARDAAGNESERSAESAFKVDPSINIIRAVSSRGGGLSCAAGGRGSAPLLLLGWGVLVLMAARRRRV